MEQATVQLLDLRRHHGGSDPELVVWASPGAELLRAVAVLVDETLSELEVTPGRLADIRGRVEPGLLDGLRELLPSPRDWVLLFGLVADLPAPGSVEDLLALLGSTPELAWRLLVASHLEEDELHPVATAVLSGDCDTEGVRAAVHDVELRERDALEAALGLDPTGLGERALGLLERFVADVGADMVAEAVGPMRREALARTAQHDDGMPVRRLVVEATNGYELGEAVRAERVLLLPSYWFRPWLVLTTHGATEVFTTPVADEHLHLPSQAPPPALVRLCKALGDEGRLQLLRRMAAGPIGLSDAMDELDVAKTTAHHHLSRLRTAGLVTVHAEGRANRYELRNDPPQVTAAALADYLTPTAALQRHRAE